MYLYGTYEAFSLYTHVTGGPITPGAVHHFRL